MRRSGCRIDQSVAYSAVRGRAHPFRQLAELVAHAKRQSRCVIPALLRGLYFVWCSEMGRSTARLHKDYTLILSVSYSLCSFFT